MGPHLRARNESEDVEQQHDDDDDTAQRDASTEFWSMVSTSRAAKRGRLVSLKEFYFTIINADWKVWYSSLCFTLNAKIICFGS